jgi:hypothetical protein
MLDNVAKTPRASVLDARAREVASISAAQVPDRQPTISLTRRASEALGALRPGLPDLRFLYQYDKAATHQAQDQSQRQ